VGETHSEKKREQTKNCDARRMRILLQQQKQGKTRKKKSHIQLNYHDLFYCFIVEMRCVDGQVYFFFF
jgi:hypothetical protein